MPAKLRHATLRKDGRWQCKVQGKTFIDRDIAEARRKADTYDAQLKLGAVEAARPKTVSVYSAEWLKTHKSGVSDKCYNDYAVQMDKLTAVCGDKQLAEVTPDDAAAVWLKYAGMSASTIKRSAQLFRAMFDAAVENDYCTKNPFRAKTAQPPKGESGTHRTLTAEEIRLIRTVEHRFRAAAMVMLYAGLRRGEVLALTAEDIDLKAGVIHVTQAVRYESNQPILDTPKTAAGIRDVPIVSDLRPILRKIKKGLIAPSARGTVMSDTAFGRAWDSYLHALSVAAGHPVSIRTHDLRHTYCTTLCDAGVPLRQAMEWLGHADEKMILKIYDHNTPARNKASTTALEAFLHPKKQKSGVKTGVNATPTPSKPA